MQAVGSTIIALPVGIARSQFEFMSNETRFVPTVVDKAEKGRLFAVLVITNAAMGVIVAAYSMAFGRLWSRRRHRQVCTRVAAERCKLRPQSSYIVRTVVSCVRGPLC